MSWSSRRKALYGGVVFGLLFVLIGSIAFSILYKPPTCFDGLKNGDESGTDCGGSCERVCPSAFLSPKVFWTSYESIAPGLYNLSAYIVNPNIDGEVDRAPYKITIYDNDGSILTEVKGNVQIPPNRNTLAFIGAVDVAKRVPYRALFEFTGPLDWYKSTDQLGYLSISNKDYSESESGSSLLVTIKNNNVNTIGRFSVYVVLYDKDSNAIGFSKTNIDGIAGRGTVTAPFTWPNSRDGKVVSIEVLPVLE